MLKMAASQCHFPYPLQCAGWPKPLTLGTFESYHHIILANELLWSGEKNCTTSPLLVNFARLFGTADAAPELTVRNHLILT